MLMVVTTAPLMNGSMTFLTPAAAGALDAARHHTSDDYPGWLARMFAISVIGGFRVGGSDDSVTVWEPVKEPLLMGPPIAHRIRKPFVTAS